MTDEINGTTAPQSSDQSAEQTVHSGTDLPDPSTLNEPATIDLSNEIIKGSESSDKAQG